jgi:hypothetical protein
VTSSLLLVASNSRDLDSVRRGQDRDAESEWKQIEENPLAFGVLTGLVLRTVG